MLDTILKVLSSIKDGFNIYRDKKKSSYSNDLEPALKDFEIVHKDYIDSLKNYLEIIKSDKDVLNINHPIFEKIKDDALFTDSLRQKLFSYYDNNKNPTFKAFNNSLFKYFMYSENVLRYNFKLNLDRELGMNAVRSEVYHGIYHILSNTDVDLQIKKKQVEKQIRCVISNLQQQYRKVIDEFNYAKEASLV